MRWTGAGREHLILRWTLADCVAVRRTGVLGVAEDASATPSGSFLVGRTWSLTEPWKLIHSEEQDLPISADTRNVEVSGLVGSAALCRDADDMYTGCPAGHLYNRVYWATSWMRPEGWCVFSKLRGGKARD